MTAPPVEDGAVLICGEQVVAVGRWQDLRNATTHGDVVIDLGERILLPGLVNAHCHLDYTHLAGHLPPPKRFTDWLQGVLGLKAGWSFSEYADSWLAGAGQLMRTGCSSVMDFEAVPELLPEVWLGTPLRVVSALEMTGVRSVRTPEQILEEALAHVARLTPMPEGKSVALAPHATYSTRPGLLRLSASAARARGWPIACHVAESEDEFDMFLHARGPMYQWLRSQRDMGDCGKGSPIRHVADHGLLGEGAMLIHVNHLAEGDEGLIARAGSVVVHCPRSHDYFRHPPFPYRRLKDAGVAVALGTDSLLSVRKGGEKLPRLNLLEEMRTFMGAHPWVSPQEVLEMVTVVGGRLVSPGLDLGCLREGAAADLMVVPYAGDVGAAAAGVVAHSGDVSGLMIGGRWVWCGDSEGRTVMGDRDSGPVVRAA